jgi:hypothetical protein
VKKLSVLLVTLVILLAFGFAFTSCGDDTGGGGSEGGGGGGGDYTVTINNIHPSYNNVEIAENSFMLLDAASSDARGSDNDSTVLNGSITTTFRYRERMEEWGGIKIYLQFDGGFDVFESTATFPVSQRKIVVDAKDMLSRRDGISLSEAR